MPGIIRVSVLEAIDLPEALTDGTTGKDVTVKVILGPRFYKTEPGIAEGGRIDSWKSEFTFPVMNLRDKLMVTICNSEDQSVTQTVIEIPSIIEKGSRDEFVELEGGGRIHLRMSFALTEEERKKIEIMRLSTRKKPEEARLKRTLVFQTVQPTYENELWKSPFSTVTVTEVDVPTKVEWKAPKSTENGPLGFGSNTKPLAPIPMFDYARAVGSQLSRCSRTKRRLDAGGSCNSRIACKPKDADMNFQGQTMRQCAKDAGKVGLSTLAILYTSVVSAKNRDRASSLTQSIGIVSGGFSNILGKLAFRTNDIGYCEARAEAFESLLPEFRDDLPESTTEYSEVEYRIESQGARNMPVADTRAMAISNTEEFILFERELEKGPLSGGPSHLPFLERMQKWDGFLRTQAAFHIKTAFPKLERQGVRFEARSGPGARWAQKSGLETRWTSPKKSRRLLREEWNCHVTVPLKARAKIFEVIRAAGLSHESYGDRSFQEHYSIADSIGVVLQKVVGGAAMLLAALFMMWPLIEGSTDGDDGLSGDDR